MAAETSKLKLGLFVLTAIGILVAALVLLGGSEFFQAKINAVTLFDESVQGLEIGSAVKARGVTIGKVTSIQLREDDSYIQVEMELYLNNTGLGAQKQAEERLRRVVDQGACCRLEYAGITGMKFIDIDYSSNRKNLLEGPAVENLPDHFIYIPSAPSLLSSITSTAMNTMSRLAEVDVEKISEDLSTAIESAARALNNEDLKKTFSNLETSSSKLSDLIDTVQGQVAENRIAETLDAYKQTAVRIQELSDKIDTRLEEAKVAETTGAVRDSLAEIKASLAKAETVMTETNKTLGHYQQLADGARQQLEAAKLAETTQALRDTTQTIRQTSETFGGTAESITDAATTTRAAVRNLGAAQRDFQLTLNRLNDTLATIDAWVQYMDEDPASLIRGKQKQSDFTEE